MESNWNLVSTQRNSNKQVSIDSPLSETEMFYLVNVKMLRCHSTNFNDCKLRIANQNHEWHGILMKVLSVWNKACLFVQSVLNSFAKFKSKC